MEENPRPKRLALALEALGLAEQQIAKACREIELYHQERAWALPTLSNVWMESIASLNLGSRITNALRAAGVNTILDLWELGDQGVCSFRNVGLTMSNQIEAALLAFRPEVFEPIISEWRNR